MIQHIQELNPNSRIWIYQADRSLNPNEQAEIIAKSNAFLAQWAAHGADLKAAAEVRNDCFLIIAADENFNAASGCSIDSQFRFIQELGASLDVDFFNRSNLAFLQNTEVVFIDMKGIKSEIEAEKILPTDTFFDNTVKTLGELSDKWMVNVNESWLKRYFRSSETV